MLLRTGATAGLFRRLAETTLKAGVRLAAEELAGARAADEFSVVDDSTATGKNGFWRAFDLDALEHGIVHAHVMRLGADNFLVIRIEEHEVRIRADGDGTFARVKAK